MPILVSLDEVEARISALPDREVDEIFPEGSFARHLYLNASEAHLANSDPAKADAAECAQWGLTPEQWASQIRAVSRARKHDAKLDLLNQGIGRGG